MVDNKEIGQGDTTHYRASSYLKISTYCHMILDVMCFLVVSLLHVCINLLVKL